MSTVKFRMPRATSQGVRARAQAGPMVMVVDPIKSALLSPGDPVVVATDDAVEFTFVVEHLDLLGLEHCCDHLHRAHMVVKLPC